MSHPSRNPFLDGPLPAIFARTALPVILVMGMNGLLTVADALFLGHYVGEVALAAVTVVFPLYMLIVAVATIISCGMASRLARHLGGGHMDAAREVFAGAHLLALAAGAGLNVLFVLFGRTVVGLAAGYDPDLMPPAMTYMWILVLCSPVFFVLSVQSDALRSEGRAGFMAAAGILVSLANMALNYLLIAVCHLGVAGSALGTVLAQAAALAVILLYRANGRTVLGFSAILRGGGLSRWGEILALGAPQGLNFMGLALISSSVMAALQFVHISDYAATVTAYGIVTRVLTFAILPVLGLSQAMQAITGNNHGAGEWRRQNASLRLALGVALVYCAMVETIAMIGASSIGGLFVDDAAVIAKVAGIMPSIVMLYLLSGPHLMLAAHFHAIGDAGRAAILGLSKSFLFAIPLTFVLPVLFGADAIWWTTPTAEMMLAGLTAAVLVRLSRRGNLRWGVFAVAEEGIA